MDRFYWSGALTGETQDAGMVALPYYPVPLGNWTYAVPFGPGPIHDSRSGSTSGPAGGNRELQHRNTYNLSKDPSLLRTSKAKAFGSYHPKILQGAGATAIAILAPKRPVIEAEFLH